MTEVDRSLMRLAIAIHQRLTRTEGNEFTIKLPRSKWRETEALCRQRNLARQRGWDLAAERVQRELGEALRWMSTELIALADQLRPIPSKGLVSSVGDIYADLIALRDEFGEVHSQSQQQTISVTTEAIELQGVYLGPFEICLDWSQLGTGSANSYQVIALDAQPAESNECVTHPHVQDEALCEGEGR